MDHPIALGGLISPLAGCASSGYTLLFANLRHPNPQDRVDAHTF